MQSAQVMTQLERTNRDLFDRAFDIAHVQIFALAKRIIKEEERARKDISDQRLRAKANRDAYDARTSKERSNIDANFHQNDQQDCQDHHDQHEIAEQGQQRGKPRGRGASAFIAQFYFCFVNGFFRDLTVNPDPKGVIDHIADEQDHHNIEKPVRVAFDHPGGVIIPDVKERISPSDKGKNTGNTAC